MNFYVSFLRGVNVGGANPIRMPALKTVYESLGFSGVQTYLQSGNVVFSSPTNDAQTLAEQIEQAIRRAFGLPIPVFIRTAADLQRLVDRNPFTHGRSVDPARLHVTFLSRPPDPAERNKLAEYHDPVDEFALGEREVYLYCPNGYGRTKLSNTFFEKKLAVLATTRNWKTVNALLGIAKSRT